MPQSLAQVYLHLVFSTKGWRPHSTAEKLRAECHADLAGTCPHRGSSLTVGGIEDHVQSCMLSRQESITVPSPSYDRKLWMNG